MSAEEDQQLVETPPNAPQPMCPYCHKSQPNVQVNINGAVVYFWCVDCRSILSCQLLAMPRMAKPLVEVPRGVVS